MPAPFELYRYRAALLRVVDGDTVQLDVDLGLETSRKLSVRLYGLNAPERNTSDGKKSMAWLIARLANIKQLYIATEKDRQEKFGRYLAVLYDEAGANINRELIEAGLAKEYYGGPRS